MDNRLGHNSDEKVNAEDTVPDQVKDAVMQYLDIDTFDIDTDSIASEIHDLILIGEKSDWEETGISGSCEEFHNSHDYPSKTRFAEELCLEGRQKVFILSLYDWIVSFSDSLQFEKFTPEEKIIADYIRKRFPGRQGRGLFAHTVSNVLGN